MSLFTSEQLRALVTTNPLRVITELPRLHPSVDMALNTALRLICTEDGLEINAESPGSQGANDTGTTGGGTQETVDPVGSASLDLMWSSLPAEVGGSLRGLRTTLMKHAILTGMPIVEAVPGPPLMGVARVWPIDSLTCELRRPDRNADIILSQRQRFPDKAPVGGSSRQNYSWVDLPPDRVFWRAFDQDVDDPYGVSMYASALNEVIADLALMQDLRDAVHNAAWPRMEVGISLTELHKVAVDVYRIIDPKRAAEWVTARFQEVVDYVATLNADDNLVHDSSGNVKTLQPGSFLGLEGVLSFLRQRIAQSLKTLPTLLGINDGSTFNYTSVEWAIYAQGLESLASMVDEVLVDVANLHLRLIGSTSVAVAKRKAIRTNDAQVDANTESTRITNATSKEKLGYLTHDQASMEITGKQSAGPAQPGVIEPLPPPPMAMPGGGGSGKIGTTRKGGPGPKNLPGNNKSGTTQEERNAKKGRPGSAMQRFTDWMYEKFGSGDEEIDNES